MSLNGQLTVTLISGHDLKNCVTFGTMSPYVKLRLNNEKFHSEPVKHGGINPLFNNRQFLFNLVNTKWEDVFSMSALSKEILTDDVIGVTGVKVKDLIAKANRGPFALELRDEDNFSEKTGYLRIDVTWNGTGATESVAAQISPSQQLQQQSQPVSPLQPLQYVQAQPTSPMNSGQYIQPHLVQQPFVQVIQPQAMMQQYTQPQQAISYEIQQTGLFGMGDYSGGVQFDDVRQLSGIEKLVQLLEVRVWAEHYVHGLQCVWLYNGQRIEGQSNTANTNNMQTLLLDVANGEHIIHMAGRAGGCIDHLIVTTSLGRRMQFGYSQGGNPFEIVLPQGSKIIGFKGNHWDNWLRNIGVVFQMPLAVQPQQYVAYLQQQQQQQPQPAAQYVRY